MKSVFVRVGEEGYGGGGGAVEGVVSEGGSVVFENECA